MDYKNWMTAVKDEIPITSVVIPSAHNAGTKGMNKMACCQDGTVYDQFTYGIRHFCIRLDTDKNGDIVLCHGITKGEKFEKVSADFGRMLKENDSEFFIFDIREYYDQKFGPVTLRFKADKNKVASLLEKYIKPSQLALCDFDDITKITMGDIRRSKKRYILINHNNDYPCSVNCKQYFPWEKKLYGSKDKAFAEGCTHMFDDGVYEGGGLFWFQTQQTPNLGTEIGITTPRKLDDRLVPYFHLITDKITSTPDYLSKANIIAGDFMTRDYMKVNRILALNTAKKNIKDEYISAFTEMTKI